MLPTECYKMQESYLLCQLTMNIRATPDIITNASHTPQITLRGLSILYCLKLKILRQELNLWNFYSAFASH